MTTNTKRDDLHKDLRTRGCPVCNDIHRAVLDFFSQWVSAFVNNEEVKDEYAAALGFCPFHTWQLESTISARGISAGYQKLLKRLSRELSELAGSSRNLAEDVEKLAKNNNCSICALMRDAEIAYVEQLVNFLRKKEGQESYARSQGVCLRHLALLLASPTERKTTWLLLTQAALRLNEAAEDMKNYVLKRDLLERHLLTKDEKDAFFRALTHIAGSKWLCAPR
jgi:hypothetical protein